MKVNTSVYEFCKYIAVIPQIIIFGTNEICSILFLLT